MTPVKIPDCPVPASLLEELLRPPPAVSKEPLKNLNSCLQQLKYDCSGLRLVVFTNKLQVSLGRIFPVASTARPAEASGSVVFLGGGLVPCLSLHLQGGSCPELNDPARRAVGGPCLRRGQVWLWPCERTPCRTDPRLCLSHILPGQRVGFCVLHRKMPRVPFVLSQERGPTGPRGCV